ncbi:MAG TPA: hypothetical protein DCG57_09355 [Candidatus Riflebacteria bacterium]|jgi:hypothetical protein|nr:hypothetical protein [Candidatus Riflebacteria bacterium]
MDNARWLVILSVVISMMATLTILNRFSPRLLPDKAVADTGSSDAARQRAVAANNPVINRVSRREIPKFSQISFPKPAAHTFVVEQSREIEKMNESLNVEGQIVR